MCLFIRNALLSISLILGLFSQSFGQKNTSAVSGRVKDPQGAVVVGAAVTLISAKGEERVITNEDGIYIFKSVVPGRYKLQAAAEGFGIATRELDLFAGRSQDLDISLSILETAAEVMISADSEINTEADNNAAATVLTGRELEALPDDPDELETALKALAGTDTGEMIVDGFSNGTVPPKERIKEIRINSNPFSAGNRRGGRGRIEIITKPGTDDFHGQISFNFNDETLNARNRSALNRAAVQQRTFRGSFSGPLKKKRASFFFDIDHGTTDDNDLINAIVLDSALQPVAFNLDVPTPSKRLSFSPRINVELNDKHSLVARYSFSKNASVESGIGGFNLLSRAFSTAVGSHSIQLTETAILGTAAVNELRIQYSRQSNSQEGDESPSFNVLESFNGGGSSIGLSSDNNDRVELHNKTTFVLGKHSITAGLDFNYSSLDSVSRNNFGGSFVFAGGHAPELDSDDQVVLDSEGNPSIVQISSLERYRRTILFRLLSYSGSQIREFGGGPTQLSIAGGTPGLKFTQWEVAPYLQDDFRVSANLTFNFGLRFERHPNIKQELKVAPRIGFAWSPKFLGRDKKYRSVIRGGIGVYYSAISEGLVMQSLRYNGITQLQYLVTDPNILDQAVFTLNGVTNVPSVADLAGYALPQTTRQLAEDIDSPRVVESSLGFERQIPFGFVFAATYTNTNTSNVLFSRNINAPLPGTFIQGDPTSGTRPFGDLRNTFQYETSGRSVRNELEFGLRSRLGRTFSIFSNYTLAFARSDIDGGSPVNQYDLSGEWGPSNQDVRHRITIGGSFFLPWGLRLDPFINASSGRPFNITTGRDDNGDTLFNERPAFADHRTPLADRHDTPFGSFDIAPKSGQLIVPRNYGRGPASFSADLRITKSFRFSGSLDPGKKRRYELTFSAQARNILNRPNRGAPVTNMSSPLFGRTISSFGSRRVDLNVRFSF